MKPKTQEQLLLELEDLRARLDEAEDTLRAIRSGEVDALVVSGVGGEQVYTLKGADHSYRVLIEDMNEGALTLSSDGVILYCNRRFAEMLKSPLEKVIGSTIHTWIESDSQGILQVLLRQSDTLVSRRGEATLLAGDGTIVPGYLSANALHSEEVQVLFCLVATDLTEQKRTEAIVASEKLARELLAASNQSRLALLSVIEDQKRVEEELKEKTEELRDMSQQLWQAAKLATMGELASSIAHELNNPLATVSLRIESLTAQTSQDDPRRRELEIIGQEVERMANLVGNLLQFSRRSQPQISTVNVCDEIEKTLELIHYHLRKHKIAVAREFKLEGPLIHADRQQLRQLFLNLFTNASDAMPKGGTLTIRVAAQPEEKMVFIEIDDTGTGIPPEILPKVMEPFYTTKPEGKGTGLGLAICRRIAQEHRGTLDITSEGIPGKGTKVRITLSSTDTGNSIGLTDL
jgi:PAS domain S-box-containing protein